MAIDPLSEAQVLLDTGQPGRARELLRSALALDPTSGPAHLLTARAAAVTGDLAGAESHARAAAADPDTRAAGFQVLARILGLDDARAPEAVQAAASAVQIEPGEWSHRAVLALALSDVGDVPAAVAQAEAAVQLAPADPSERSRALVSLAQVFLAQPAGRERGYHLMREAAALDPTDAHLQLQVMIAQFTSGRRADAMRTAFASLRVTPTAAVPPLVARFSLYFLLRRLLGWLLLVSFAVPLVFFGIVGNLGEPSLLQTAPDAVVRTAGAVGLLAFAGVIALVLRPLFDRSTARAVWRFARRSGLAWCGGSLVVLALLSYAAALLLGAAAFAGVPLPLLLMIVAWLVHSIGAFALRLPDPATLLAAQAR
ncbi:tetratricopeptide repeat protein [Microbacterium hibisci]|uniref:tetratricopeptide repeat protein n=1 Tax=Microbacterium hibisci TaxID=2036000 RepID=UPI001943D07F|nr:tetratricopeptide repeat protein [Microbacterium hibisci]